MVWQKVYEQGRDYKSESKYTKPYPYIFLHYRYSSVENMQGMGLSIFTFTFISSLPCSHIYFLPLHPYIFLHFYVFYCLYIYIYISNSLVNLGQPIVP